MSHITLVRHGQANTAARDELSYDRLSALGRQQARWLGDHLRDSGEQFARGYCGTLRRHRETAEEMALGLELVVDSRLDEFEYFTMAQLCQVQHGVAMPTCREEFSLHMPRLLGLWREGALEGAPVAFDAFQARVSDVLHDIAGGDGRAVVVTSGGVIGMAMRLTMDLGMGALANACLAIENSSLHRFQPMPSGLVLTQFNSVPHLEGAARSLQRTHL
ncbi:phosphoglycerate mutase [Salipiger aestuarii]|uniref:Broad specificity phosphatase PhoE n=1 Tax=Salipiger aestuarii TaxID=568098 RepID=A0A327YE58_9RHOB|nr:histidine phosphatase family protein [Salipiger aestuarii]EIE52638.1 phosphoglycerate mutase family protein [Citreicella sp. 357]KAA8609480.1 phosphoglycerate mutase [Salipiger aestuarii]KAA8610862.1 phosphoglycerate mutase [Salipiger aestuarii]KAB2542462.1 phosphoglycerate mutase [Salipiger aestuarii]RAK18797.1 broad specificity phosphatase PhoE [Salipiger aestuarii]